MKKSALYEAFGNPNKTRESLVKVFIFLLLTLPAILFHTSPVKADINCASVQCASAARPNCLPGEGLQTVTDENGCCSKFICKPIPQICNRPCPKIDCLKGQRPVCSQAQNAPGEVYRCCPTCQCVPTCYEPCPKIDCLPEQRPCCWWPQVAPGQAQPCCPTCKCMPNCNQFPR